MAEDKQSKNFLQALPIKIFLPVVLTVLLFVLTIFFVVLPRFEKNMMDDKRELIREITQVAVSAISDYYQKEKSGSLTREEAQKLAIDHLRRLRYGPELKDYFWINDMHPYLLMHPYRPDLEGGDISHFTDPGGKRLFVEMVQTVKAGGSGYVDYDWQWKDDPERIVPKISYVEGFEPWGWIVGTGIYVEDVREEIESITFNLTVTFLGILGLILGLSLYILWQSFGVEKQKSDAVAALKKSEEKYRLLAETSTEIILTMNLEGDISYVNRAGVEISGYTADEIVDHNIEKFLPPDRYESFKRYLSKRIAGDIKNGIYETNFLSKTGAIPIEVVFSIISDHGKPTGVFVAARDVTEKKKAEEQARIHQEQLFQAAKMASLGTLVSGVAHEVNNPITSVMLNAPILQKVWNSVLPILDEYCHQNGEFYVGNMSYSRLRERIPSLLSGIADGASRVKNIVSDLKDFAQQKPSELNDTVDANRVIKKSVGLVSNLINKATGNFSVEYFPNLPKFRGNYQRLEQVVINLLVNACQALPDNQRALKVRTGYDATEMIVFIEVSDEGIGIPPEVMNRIGDPFFTTKRDTGGTGLGLAISRRIIEDHKGTLEIESEPDKGTTVRIRIPNGTNNAAED